MTEPPVNLDELAHELAGVSLAKPHETISVKISDRHARRAVELIDKLICQRIQEFVQAHEENAPHFYRDGSSS